MKDIMFVVSLGLALLISVACSNDSVAEWLAPQVKYPFVIINKGVSEATTFEKTYDCDSKVIIYNPSYNSMAVIPFQTEADNDMCKGNR